MRLYKPRSGPFKGYYVRDERHWFVQLTASIFSWRPRWYRRRQIEKLKREIQQSAQETINAALDGVQKALAFLESLPEPPPHHPVSEFFNRLDSFFGEPPRRGRYRSLDIEPLITDKSRPRRYRPRHKDA
jgi:hypothetical protein